MSSANLELTKQTVSVPEAGRILGIGRNAAYEAVRTGKLPVLKFGRRMVVPVVALDQLLESARLRPCQEAVRDEVAQPISGAGA